MSTLDYEMKSPPQNPRYLTEKNSSYNLKPFPNNKLINCKIPSNGTLAYKLHPRQIIE